VAKSEILQSPVLLRIPWNLLSNSLSSAAEQGFQRIQIPNQTVYHQDIPVEINNIQMDISYRLRPFGIYGLQTQIQSDYLRIRAVLGEIKISKTIERIVNGTTVQVSLTAVCEPTVLFQNEASIGSVINLSASQGSLTAQINDLDFNWSVPWTVEDMSCTGPVDLAEMLKQQFQRQLSEIEPLKLIVKTYLQNYLQTVINSIVEKSKISVQWSALDNQSLGIGINQIFEADSKNISMGGVLAYQNENPQRDLQFDFNATDLAETQINENLQMVFPESWLIATMESLSVSKQSLYRAELNSFKSFSSFLKNRFLQFFLWPDLMNFSKKARFTVILNASEPAKLSWPDTKTNQIQVSALMNAWISGQRNNEMQDYLYLKNSVSFTSEFKILDESLNLSFQNISARVKTQVQPSYQQKFGFSGWLATSVLKKSIVSALNNQAFAVKIPQAQIGGQTFAVDSLNRENGFIFVNFKNK
jgi:hypothetical protein